MPIKNYILRKKEKTEIVKTLTSEYLINKILKARNKEIKKDDDNKKMKHGKMKNQENKDLNSYYRVFSRMFSNFVFPEEIDRPWKSF